MFKCCECLKINFLPDTKPRLTELAKKVALITLDLMYADFTTYLRLLLTLIRLFLTLVALVDHVHGGDGNHGLVVQWQTKVEQ